MRRHGVGFNSFTLSSLFNGLMFGINGDRCAGALKAVELYPSLVTPLNLNHLVSTPILRALADVAPPSQVEQFWSFCAKAGPVKPLLKCCSIAALGHIKH
jgi:hypothetical protein